MSSIRFQDYRELPLYEVQRALTMELWYKGYAPYSSRQVIAPCAPCVVKGYTGYIYKGDPLHTHHLIIPRGYTRNLKRNVHWFWNLIPTHALCHTLAHDKELREQLVLKQAELIGWYVLHEEDMAAQLGLQWIHDQIQLEGLKIHIPLPVTKY